MSIIVSSEHMSQKKIRAKYTSSRPCVLCGFPVMKHDWVRVYGRDSFKPITYWVHYQCFTEGKKPLPEYA